MSNICYKFYSTILDAFQNYLRSDVIYRKYYGFSENPPFDEDEFRKNQFKSLIDRINRVPFDSEKADRGTAFNEIIDCMIEDRKSDKMLIDRIYEKTVVDDYQYIDGDVQCKKNEIQTEKVIAIKATYNERMFSFPISLCREFSDYFSGALTQQRVEAILPTNYGNVLLYGFIDELMPMSVHDIKTTESYTVGKFKNNFQHLVYPYCLMKNGSDVRLFEYNVAELSKRTGFPTGTFTETYVFEPDRDIPILTSHVEQFIEFLEENKHLITDRKIFALE